VTRRPRLVALLVAAALIGPCLASPAEAVDLKAKRRSVRAKRARAAATIATLRATDRQVTATLNRLSSDRAARERDLALARSLSASAERAVRDAHAAEIAMGRRLTTLRSAARVIAVQAFMNGSARPLTPLPGESPIESTRRAFFADIGSGRVAEVGDLLRATEEDLMVARQQREAAALQARERQRAVAGRVALAKQSEQQQRKTTIDVEARLEQRLAEAANLATLDSRLAAEIQRQQDAIARRIPTSSRGGTYSGIRLGHVVVSNVRGIVVATSIAKRVDQLIVAAAKDGIRLGGGGYRSSAAQVASRRAHCGSSSYDIYRKPASQCRPPSARPGLSMHERGLAIDFTSGGSIVSSRSRAYRWLRAHAGRYGLRNLPGEPWHWSTNGR
jgi:LAS superfamily LD-carboxypeptidase LdcB